MRSVPGAGVTLLRPGDWDPVATAPGTDLTTAFPYSISASRRKLFSSLHDPRSIPYDCGSLEHQARVCVGNESPSGSMDRCHAKKRFSSAYLAGADTNSPGIPR